MTIAVVPSLSFTHAGGAETLMSDGAAFDSIPLRIHRSAARALNASPAVSTRNCNQY